MNGRSVFTSLGCPVQRGQHPEHRLLLMCWMRTSVSEVLQSDSKSPQRPGWRRGPRPGGFFGRGGSEQDEEVAR